jgi:CDP-diacylglycerol--glycerol-3-phosphate 3-phosphatidyltransferase
LPIKKEALLYLNMANREFINQQTTFNEVFTLQRLQKEWWAVSLFYLIVIMGCFSLLSTAWQPTGALKWLLPAAAVNFYVLWLLWKALKKNYHPVTKILLPYLGYATWLTLLRGGLIGTLAGFVFQNTPITAEKSNWLAWTPGTIYILAILLDYFDGYVARITRHETRLGEWLDTKIDALGLLVAPVLAIGYGRLPIFYIAVSSAYYLFQFGTWYRKKNGRPVIQLAPHPAKRMIAGFQMGLVALALLPVFSRPVMTIAALIFMIPLLAGFVRDWLVICGYVEINHLQQTRWDHSINFLITKLLPVFLRFVIGVAGIFFFYQAVTVLFTGQETVSGTPLYLSTSYHLHELLITASAALLVAFGIVTRVAALLISIFLAGALTTWNSPPGLFFLFSCATTLILTGSGFLSTWHPEDRLLLERQG